ncbi:MAG TPA: tetratricopeptide repeat protein, partial [Anaeromyxobacteraceae bacterium]
MDPARELALGRAARVEGRSSQARGHLERAIQAAPNRAEARLELAELLVADGVELDRARILLQQAQLLRGDPARIARAGGALEELQGQEALAVESYARALELS